MRRCRLAVAAMLALTALPEVLAQPATEGGTSVVMRCRDCGVIASVREIQRPREGAVPGGASNAGPIGLVINIPTGSGHGQEAYVGAVGTREWQKLTSSTSYEFTVRMDDGGYRLAQKDGPSDLQAGERVRVVGGQIQRVAR